jgi:hypothetical protein
VIGKIKKKKKEKADWAEQKNRNPFAISFQLSST